MNEIVTSDVTKSQIKVQLGLCQVPRSDSKTGIYLVLETENPPYIYFLNQQLSSEMVKKVCLH